MILAALGPPLSGPRTDAERRRLDLPVVIVQDRTQNPKPMRSPVTQLADERSAFGRVQGSTGPAATGRSYYFGMAGLPQTGLNRKIDARWEGAQRLGRRPAMQFHGPGEESVSIKGVIYPPNFGDFGMLESMRRECLTGAPRTFVTQYGAYHGVWCIKSVSDDQAPYWPDGHPRKVEFTIELTHYGSDGAGFGLGSFSIF